MENREMEYPVNSIRICVDQENKNGEAGGRICSTALEKTLLFHNCGDLLLKIDEAFDQIGRPQPYQLIRSFRKDTSSYKSYIGKPIQCRSSKEIYACRGKICTFDVVMVSRKHAEWQGILKGMDGNTSASFRTSMECMEQIEKMLRSAHKPDADCGKKAGDD